MFQYKVYKPNNVNKATKKLEIAKTYYHLATLLYRINKKSSIVINNYNLAQSIYKTLE
jgi:hypothetical protein